MQKWLRILVRDEQGVTTLEYAVVLALVAVAGILVWQTFGDTVNESGLDSTQSMNRAHEVRHGG